VKLVRFIVRALAWLLGLALLLAAASWLDKVLGTGRVLLGIALGLAAAAILFALFVRHIGRIAQRAADDRRHRLKPAPFPEEPFASYDWTVRTLGGEPFPMEKIRREVVFLNFWSTTCVPCLSELPSIQRLYDRIASEGVVFMCIALDAEAERVREAVARNSLNVPVFLLENDQIPIVRQVNRPANG
jgi:thiol-disulfide isomerase/thioredoxin